jgi:hypothetical protein
MSNYLKFLSFVLWLCFVAALFEHDLDGIKFAVLFCGLIYLFIQIAKR